MMMQSTVNKAVARLHLLIFDEIRIGEDSDWRGWIKTFRC